MKKFLKDFEAFAMQGNVIDLAVGVMIGTAFGKIVSSLVSDIFMPLIGLLTGGLDFSNLFISLNGKSYATLQQAVDDGAATLNYGTFLTNVIDFVLIALCVFLFVKMVTRVMPKKVEAPKEEMRTCPYCRTQISAEATRCPNCTAEVEPTKKVTA